MNERKVRFNFVDVLILLLLGLAAALVLLVIIPKLTGNKADSEKKTVIHYTVEIQNIDSEIADTIKNSLEQTEDAVVMDGIDQQSFLGTVESVEEAAYEKIVFDYENDLERRSVVPDKSCLRVTITAEAVETANSFVVNGHVIRVGEQYSLILPNFYGYGYCISLNIDGKAPGEELDADERTEGNPGMIPFISPLFWRVRHAD
jgi:hypothetical protein